VLIGSSSRDIHLSAKFIWNGDQADQSTEIHQSYNVASKIKDLLSNQDARAILEHHLPEMVHAPELSMAMEMSLESIAPFAPQILTKEKLAQIDKELKGL
jgi:beta-glucosidase